MVRSLKFFSALCVSAVALLSCANIDDNKNRNFSDPLEVACALADTWIATYAPEDTSFSWDSGLLMLSLWELYLRTNELKYREYVKRWMDHHIQNGYVIAFNDHVPPARVALRLWKETGEFKYFKVVWDARDYIFHKASRTPDGGLNHLGWISGNQLWVDTLFMVTPFLVELGKDLGDGECFDEAVLQFEVFSNRLRDPDTGLYRHMYNADTDELMPPVPDYWGRGNAWVVAASSIALGLLPRQYAGYEGIRARFLQQIKSMARLLDPSGRWHTIMNRPNTYFETSTGLLTAFGIYEAVKAGISEENILQVAEKAFSGGVNQVVIDKNEGALLLGTSYGTGPSTWEMYQYVLKGEQVSYGVGAFILAAIARDKCGVKEPIALGSTDETYIKQPSSDDSVEWGYFYLARGNLSKSLARFNKALEIDANSAQALFGVSLVEAIYFALDALDLYNRYSVGSASFYELLSFLGSDAKDFGKVLSERMKVVKQDTNFVRAPERIVISGGGSIAVGSVEIDLGEVYLLEAIGLLLWGMGDLVWVISPDFAMPLAENFSSPNKLDTDTLVEALDKIAASLGVIVDGIVVIDSEIDGQSDDFLPANFLQLEGTFDIPGVFLPTPVEEVWAMLGIDPRKLFGDGPMPQAMIDWLLNVKEIVEFIRDLIAGIDEKGEKN